MLLMILSSLLFFHYIDVPVVNMRQEPSRDAAVVSQAIFAEEVKLLETSEAWVKIETLDSCQGWVQKEALCEREESYADCSCVKPMVEIIRLMAHVYAKPDAAFGPLFTLPFGCQVELADHNPVDSYFKIKLPDTSEAYMRSGDATTDIRLLTREEMLELSHRFIDLPFTSGGRSSFGFDSSGFIQMLYRQMGFTLPRTAIEQFKWDGFESISLDQLDKGDLLFCGNSENKIEHVGMYIGENRFIHVAQDAHRPWLRISDLEAMKQWSFCSARKLK